MARWGDFTFGCLFFVFIVIAVFIDCVPCFTGMGPVTLEKVDAAAWPPLPLRRAWHWWATEFDPLLGENPLWILFFTWFSPIVYAPMYVLFIVDLWKGAQLSPTTRKIGLMYSAMMVYSVLGIGVEALFGALPSPQPVVFLLAYGAYVAVPVAWAVRVWPEPVRSKRKVR